VLSSKPLPERSYFKILYQVRPSGTSTGDRNGYAFTGQNNALPGQRAGLVLTPIVKRCGETGKKLYFRADAATCSPDVYEYLEREEILHAIRIKANNRLYEEIDHLMGRPSAKPKVLYHDFSYRAGSWDRARRVIAKVEWHQGELIPRIGFILTNLSRAVKNLVRFYNKKCI